MSKLMRAVRHSNDFLQDRPILVELHHAVNDAEPGFVLGLT